MMVARIWRRWTRRDNAAAYTENVRATGFNSYLATPGNRGAFVLRRDEGDRTEFLSLSLWDSLEAARRFPGEPLDRARRCPEDERYLVDREPSITHFDVVVP
jgi:heme-degrading monooxygenase HmoA